jgi:MerR HTH family regulatory protein
MSKNEESTKLCRACAVHEERIIELVDIGVLEPLGREPARWRFGGASLHRARKALRLQRDLTLISPERHWRWNCWTRSHRYARVCGRWVASADR